ncbi:MAG: ROK family protein [Alphaproteobacteria bacterium]|nr:ROK family protein [Alphaproteobacteria bacterium]
MSDQTGPAPAGPAAERIRIGIDLGGTKIEGIALNAAGGELLRQRIAAPRGDYRATIGAIADVVSHLMEVALDKVGAGGTRGTVSVGVGMPGSMSPASGRVQNANSTWLNGQPFDRDLETALGHPVRLANDANCFAISEAVDGAGAGAISVFGVILGTGVGGGLVIGGRIVDGPRGAGGEWGHNSLPWPQPGEVPGPLCWCGRRGCMEAWVSGPALARDFAAQGGEPLSAESIALLAANGNADAKAALNRHCDRLARGLAHVINIVDPEVVVLGGGLSNLPHLYSELPQRMAPLLFTDTPSVRILPPHWGDSGGARGAAWLWE